MHMVYNISTHTGQYVLTLLLASNLVGGDSGVESPSLVRVSLDWGDGTAAELLDLHTASHPGNQVREVVFIQSSFTRSCRYGMSKDR